MSGEPGNPNKHGVYLGEDYDCPPSLSWPEPRSTATTGPHCNHDPAAVRDGICECGEIVGPCTECGTSDGPFTEINLEAVCEGCAAELNAAGEGIALDFIAAALNGTEWNADTCDSIAAILRGTGREIRDIPGADDVACGQADEEAQR